METRNRELASLTLTVAIALSANACDGGGSRGDSRLDRAAPPDELSPSTSWMTSFLDPLTRERAAHDLFEVEAANAEFWRAFAVYVDVVAQLRL